MAELDIDAREVHASPKIVMLSLSGGVDAKSYPKLESALKSAHKQGCCRLILNLSGLRFMNEADKLLKYDAAFRRAGGGIVLYELPAKLKVMFQTLEIDKKLFVASNRAAAIEKLAAGAPAAEPAPKPAPAPAPEPVEDEIDEPAAAAPAPASAPAAPPPPKPARRRTTGRRKRPPAAEPAPSAKASGGNALLIVVAIVVVLGAAAAFYFLQ